MPHIEVEHVAKSIKGNIILQNINLSLDGGKIYGFIGRNGAGKSMLLRIIGQLVKPTSGEVRLDGSGIGIVIEHASLYPQFTALKNLEFLANINKKIGSEEVKQAIRAVGLDPLDKRKLGKYSLGMRQRIAIAQAIMEKPDFLLLDEPTNALDEEGVKLIRQLIMDEAKRGAVVLLASHNKEDIAELCDTTYRMSNGRMETGE